MKMKGRLLHNLRTSRLVQGKRNLQPPEPDSICEEHEMLSSQQMMKTKRIGEAGQQYMAPVILKRVMID
jgi:hypothetical protein